MFRSIFFSRLSRYGRAACAAEANSLVLGAVQHQQIARASPFTIMTDR